MHRMTREALLGPVQAIIDAVPSSSSITLAKASSMSSRPYASEMKESPPSSSVHSSADSFRTRRVEEADGELQAPIPLRVWMCFTKAETATEVSELPKWLTIRFTYSYATMRAILFAGFRTGNITLSCSFCQASSSDTLMTWAATLIRRALMTSVVGYTAADEDAVRISPTSVFSRRSCTENNQKTTRKENNQKTTTTRKLHTSDTVTYCFTRQGTHAQQACWSSSCQKQDDTRWDGVARHGSRPSERMPTREWPVHSP